MCPRMQRRRLAGWWWVAMSMMAWAWRRVMHSSPIWMRSWALIGLSILAGGRKSSGTNLLLYYNGISALITYIRRIIDYHRMCFHSKCLQLLQEQHDDPHPPSQDQEDEETDAKKTIVIVIIFMSYLSNIYRRLKKNRKTNHQNLQISPPRGQIKTNILFLR